MLAGREGPGARVFQVGIEVVVYSVHRFGPVLFGEVVVTVIYCEWGALGDLSDYQKEAMLKHAVRQVAFIGLVGRHDGCKAIVRERGQICDRGAGVAIYRSHALVASVWVAIKVPGVGGSQGVFFFPKGVCRDTQA